MVKGKEVEFVEVKLEGQSPQPAQVRLRPVLEGFARYTVRTVMYKEIDDGIDQDDA